MNGCAKGSFGEGLVREVLGGVDCNVRGFSQAGFEALTAPGSLYPTILTTLLTVYVAVLGYRLMFGVGGARFGRWRRLADPSGQCPCHRLRPRAGTTEGERQEQ